MSFSEGTNIFAYWMIDYDLKQITPLDFSAFQPSYILNFSELSASPACVPEQQPPLQLVSTNQMLYMERGDLILYVGEEKLIPKAPCLIFLPPAKPYSIVAMGQDILLYLVPFSLHFLLYSECEHFFRPYTSCLGNFSDDVSAKPTTAAFPKAYLKKPRFLKHGSVSHSVFSKSEVLFFISILCSCLLTPASLRARF